MDNVFDFLKKLNISYEVYNHPAVFTVEESKQHRIGSGFGENKNLFLRNNKGNKHYLITISSSKKLDIDNLAKILGEKSLGFASEERLKKYLNLTPGSVSPFGLVNDANKEVIFVFDRDLLKYNKLGFHPNINTQTVIISTDDFKKFIESTGNKTLYLDL